VLSLPLAGGVAGSCLVNLRSGQPAAFRIRPAWLWWGGGILLVFSILRNLPGAGFAWLGLHS